MRDSLPLPHPPQNFSVVGVANGQGRYILGHDKFYVSSTLHITSRFQRDVTLHDDVYLGLLSVVLIAIFSDILHTFILRSSRDTTRSRLRLVCAFLLSEFAHFRNVLRHCAPIHRILLASSSGAGAGGGTGMTVRLSVNILFFTSLLFFADFLSIFYTQQSALMSDADQFNLVAYHPAAATLGQSKYIRRLVGDRPCVSPFMISTDTQRVRNYQLITCVKLSFGYATPGERTTKVETTTSAAAAVAAMKGGDGDDVDDEVGKSDDAGVARTVVIESFFHRGGADHNITYGGGVGGGIRFVTVSVRAQIVVSKASGGARHILFRRVPGDYFVDDDDVNNGTSTYTTNTTNTTNSKSSSFYPLTAHIHRLVLHGAAEWVCRKHGARHIVWCATQRNYFTSANTNTPAHDYSSTVTLRDVYLWRGKHGDVMERGAKGLRTTYADVMLPNATWALNAGVRWLMSAGYVQEERGKGSYVRVSNGSVEDGIAGLLTEHGRKLGLLSMMVMVGVAMGVMVVCRKCLRPISLGEVVITNLDRGGGGGGAGGRVIGEVQKDMEMEEEIGEEKGGTVGAKGGNGWSSCTCATNTGAATWVSHGHGDHGHDVHEGRWPAAVNVPEFTVVIGSDGSGSTGGGEDGASTLAVVGARGSGGVGGVESTGGWHDRRSKRRRGRGQGVFRGGGETGIGTVVGAGSVMDFSYRSDDDDGVDADDDRVKEGCVSVGGGV